MIFRARQFQFNFPSPALVMGIVNVTPDSFSDGGRYGTEDQAVAHGMELAAEGAAIIDVGGESTRPGACPVEEGEEMARVLPVIRRLVSELRIPISVDTMKSAVAAAALDAGASIINDVASGCPNAGMARLAAESGAGYVLMHMKGMPRDMQRNPEYADVAGEVDAFFEAHLARLTSAGVREQQLVLDVGIGFGKKMEHNLELLACLSRFKKWNRPGLLGVSRKSFLGQLTGAPVEERLAGSLACACWAVQNGVQMIRTHDVAATVQAIRVTEAILGRTIT
jgi:dihydropteroate synthase